MTASARTCCETRTWTGSGVDRCNEDYACASADARCAVLVDGATGLTGVNLVLGESDAAWYARNLARGALGRMSADPCLGAADALRDSGLAVADAYHGLPGAGDLSPADRPNGSAAALRWDAELVDVVMLGDCTAVVGLRDGTSHVIHDATLDALDQENYDLMYRHATETGTSMAEARRALNDRFVANRLLLNEPGGYWAADVSCRGFGHELVRTFGTEEVSYVVMCSDGFAAAVNMGVVSGPEELARRVADGGGERLGEELRLAERRDADCWEHPRSKTSDDATYVLVSFEFSV